MEGRTAQRVESREYQRDPHPLCKTMETGDEDAEPAWTASPVCVQGKVSTQHAPQ